ncbi:hypothetical protein [Pseudomonas sp.]|uniref:hypothetical protein n=1 Tax=Pseudomonas sp. TaxID=306 RepID=UPI0019F0F1E6|nr:hypothetical protein [Pseudomonas sp.]MBF0677223.1 hypothetical protein [Pseudomonas sp.]
MRRLILLLSVALLGSCSWVGNAIKEGAIEAVSYSSRAHFTLTGKVPADYAFKYTAYYQPEKSTGCVRFSPGMGGYVPREHAEQAKTEPSSEAQTFSYRIPLAYQTAGCTLKLANVDLLAFATYQPGDFGTGSDGGALGIYDTLPDSVPPFPTSGVRELRGTCMWLFRLMGNNNSLVKGLVCHKADEHWAVPQDYDQRRRLGATLRRNELNGKTVHVEFRHSQEERPLFRGTWLNTTAGWKPCIETHTSIRCQNPPEFRPFLINGRKCTVYPNCTE